MGENNVMEGTHNLRCPVYVDEFTNEARAFLKIVGKKVLFIKKQMLEHGFVNTKAQGDKELESEALANVTLAFRHVEDAAMRLGKVLQALNGGESIYDNSGVVGQKVG